MMLKNKESKRTMHLFVTILGLLVVVALFAVLARRFSFPLPIVLVIVGLGVSLIPGLPHIELEPDIVFMLFLPPILYAAAWYTSWQEFKANIEPITVLSVGLVFATTLVVAWAAYTFIPGMPWTVACVLGAIVSPPDAAAATAVTSKLGIPKRIITVLEGESLVNDASGLVAYKFAVAAVVTGTFSLSDAGLKFSIVILVGIAIGFAVAWIAKKIHRMIDVEPSVDITITILTPFASYLLAEKLGASGVIAVVTTGLIIGREAATLHRARMRMAAIAVWDFIIFLLNGLIFIIIGLKLPDVIEKIDRYSPSELAFYVLVVNAAAIGVRLVFIYTVDYISRTVRRRLGKKGIFTTLKHTTILAWTGMRGIVSLAAALALPYTLQTGAPFPHRDIILFLTFSVIVVTLVLQGLSLPWLIRALKVGRDEEWLTQHEKEARLQAINAAQRFIATKRKEMALPEYLIASITASHDHRILHLGHEESDGSEAHEIAVLSSQLHRAALAVERDAIIAMRNQGVLSDEAMRRIERDLDIEELRLPLH
jgi:CPA1 family monovalent cation:H+ antiporter